MTAVWPYASFAPDVSGGSPVYPSLPAGLKSFSVSTAGAGGSDPAGWWIGSPPGAGLSLLHVKAILDEIAHLSTPVWQMPIDYGVAVTGGATFSINTSGALVGSGFASQATVLLPLAKAHIGQPITDVLARISQGGGTAVVVELYKITGLSTTGGAPTATLVATATSPGAGQQLLTLTPGSPITLSADEALVVRWKPSNTNDTMYGLRFD